MNEEDIVNPVILFDGLCNLCSSSVQYVIEHDKKRLFRFASLQSEAGERLLQRFKLSAGNLNSFVLIKNGKAYSRSSAALQVARQLDGFVKLLYILIVVPRVIRNAVYQFIANNRYKWFGKKETCWLPSAELKSLFLN